MKRIQKKLCLILVCQSDCFFPFESRVQTCDSPNQNPPVGAASFPQKIRQSIG